MLVPLANNRAVRPQHGQQGRESQQRPAARDRVDRPGGEGGGEQKQEMERADVGMHSRHFTRWGRKSSAGDGERSA